MGERANSDGDTLTDTSSLPLQARLYIEAK